MKFSAPPLLLLLWLACAGTAVAQDRPPGMHPPPPGAHPPPPGARHVPPPPPQPPGPTAPPAPVAPPSAAGMEPVAAAPVEAPVPGAAGDGADALPPPVQPFPQLERPPATAPLEFGETQARPTAVELANEAPVVASPPVLSQRLPRWLWLLAGACLLLFLGWRASARRSRELAAVADRLARDQRALKSQHVQLKSHSEQLRQLATNDPLTGVLNRQGFSGELRAVLDHLARFRRPLNLVLMDMDNFKQINDRLGHLVGDQSLKLVVGVVRQHLASEDLFGRFGGDEFMIACADQPLEATAALAESIRAGVVRAATAHEPPLAGLSLSMGIAQANEELGYRPETLFHRADTALYAAKNGGRNRVVLADESLPPPPVLEAATRHLD